MPQVIVLKPFRLFEVDAGNKQAESLKYRNLGHRPKEKDGHEVHSLKG
jgi:hypothetical protein